MYERIYLQEQLEDINGKEILGWMKPEEVECICYIMPESWVLPHELNAENIDFYMDMEIGHLFLTGKKAKGV